MRWELALPRSLVFNARSDRLATNPLWQDMLQRQRCIVPADAIFESKHLRKSAKNPEYEITVPGSSPFGIAGIWKLWEDPRSGEIYPAVTIITTDPNEAWEKAQARPSLCRAATPAKRRRTSSQPCMVSSGCERITSWKTITTCRLR